MLKHFLVIASSFCLSVQAFAAEVPSCFPQGGFNAQGAQARSAREIALPSRDQLLLAGIEVPAFVEARTKARLKELIAQKNLRYAPLGAQADRYGRIAADVSADNVWIHGALVEEGLALAMPVGLKSPCAVELMAIEEKARDNRAGLWVQPAAAQFDGADHEALGKAAGQFAVIEGRVLNVGERDYAVFLNFGHNYKRDFTVIVAKKHRAALEGKRALATLKDKRVRVRGVVEVKTNPRLHLKELEALEVLE